MAVAWRYSRRRARGERLIFGSPSQTCCGRVRRAAKYIGANAKIPARLRPGGVTFCFRDRPAAASSQVAPVAASDLAPLPIEDDVPDQSRVAIDRRLRHRQLVRPQHQPTKRRNRCRNAMLRADTVQAVKRGRWRVLAVEVANQATMLLTS